MTRDDRGRQEAGDGDTPRRDEAASGDDSSRPLDLAPLRGDAAAFADSGRWEALARRIDAAAAPELTRRARAARSRGGVGGGGAPELLVAIARATRPALMALAASAVLAVALARSDGASATAESSLAVAEVSVAQALRVDEPAASWILQQRAPSAQDVARVIDPEAGQ